MHTNPNPNPNPTPVNLALTQPETYYPVNSRPCPLQHDTFMITHTSTLNVAHPDPSKLGPKGLVFVF